MAVLQWCAARCECDGGIVSFQRQAVLYVAVLCPSPAEGSDAWLVAGQGREVGSVSTVGLLCTQVGFPCTFLP